MATSRRHPESDDELPLRSEDEPDPEGEEEFTSGARRSRDSWPVILGGAVLFVAVLNAGLWYVAQRGKRAEARERTARADAILAQPQADAAALDQAIEEYRRAVAMNPALAAAHKGLGRALLRKGDRKGAASELREALRLKPDDLEARQALESLPSDPADKEQP